ncbi:MAG: hypothetical protein JO063_05735 [Pseudonocardiales bacterium]|nr:hypothetical protein [Pseudonocardiales bacterium]MBV9032666.1 hypothetical protein [Pseudonocardiales bacterium]MBW0009609.1 hypothetical protein [Pseudonocardiales bacterium]
MTTPHPPKSPESILAWLWKVTAHPVIAGLVVAGILTMIGVLFATNSNGNKSVPSGPGLDTAQSTSPPGHSTTQPTSPLTPAPPCPKQAASSADPAHEATGPPPWTVEGYGIRYTVVSVTRTTSEWVGATKPSITVTSCVTRTESADYNKLSYRFSDAASNSALDSVPFQGGGDGDPPLNQTSRLISVVWDVAPSATHLTITLHDLFWPDSHNLTMQNVPVSP